MKIFFFFTCFCFCISFGDRYNETQARNLENVTDTSKTEITVIDTVKPKAKPAKANKTHKMEATYYGNNYKGSRHTANGDKFNKNAMTCAAPKKFKFGTMLKVTNPDNGKSVIVKVTDRGANDLKGKVIDLTYGAFGKICDHRKGRINVIVEEI